MATLGDRLSDPHPAEIALLIYVPVSAATLRDLHPPMVICRRDCECKCDGSCHHHPAKNSNKERAFHFHVPF